VTSFTFIELACAALLGVSGVLRARTPGARAWLGDAPIVFLGALAGEDSAIRLYGFYSYAEGWHCFADQVPLLIPLIWVFVVLSARDVAGALGGPLPLTAFALIVFDAALIEPCSTQSGLWTWAEPGGFKVPYIGVLGWACFGASAIFWLQRLRGPARWLTVLLAPFSMHALLLALWWGGLRWFGRAEADPAHLAAAAWLVSSALVVGLVLARRAGVLPLPLILPRLGPAGFFLALLATHGAPTTLWAWALAFVPPWLVATRWSVATAVISRAG
jgi:Carotenoid biosynthesis protein